MTETTATVSAPVSRKAASPAAPKGRTQRKPLTVKSPTARKAAARKGAAKRRPVKLMRDGKELAAGAHPLHSEGGEILLPWGMTKNNQPLTLTRAKELAAASQKREALRERFKARAEKKGGAAANKAVAKRILFPLWCKGETSADALHAAVGGGTAQELVTRSTVVWWGYFWKRGLDMPQVGPGITAETVDKVQRAGAKHMKDNGFKPLPGRETENPYFKAGK